MPVTLYGTAGRLEGLLQVQEPSDHAVAAVVCHPHPLHGGTMHNKVAHRVATVLLDRGAAVLRFNFRGAGKSEGHFDQGRGEVDDARAALAHLRERFPAAKRWVAGFSFGAWVATSVAVSEPDVERLVLVAPPVATASFEVLRSSPVPKGVVQGSADRICPVEALDREFPTWSEPKRLVLVEGANHFFDRRLSALSQALVEVLSAPQRSHAS